MKINSLVIGGIPVTILSNSDDAKQSTTGIFCLHGRQSSAKLFIQKYANFCESLLSGSQFTLILIDQRNHGQRLVNAIHNDSARKNSNHAIDMYSIQYGTAMDISYLIDTIPLHFEINKWAVIGFSLGGHAALISHCRDQRLALAVSVVGCGDYEMLMKSRNVEVSPSLNALIRSHDPVYLAGSLIGRPLLCLYGKLDFLVPVSSNNRFHGNMTSNSKSNVNDFQIVVDDDAGHEFSEFMQTEAIRFINLHLSDK